LLEYDTPRRKKEDNYVQVRPNKHITTSRNLGRSHKDMSAVPACTVDADAVFAGMRCCRVEGYFAALVAVIGVDGPGGLVPSILEPFADLGDDGQGCQGGEGEEAGFGKHGCFCCCCCYMLYLSVLVTKEEDEGCGEMAWYLSVSLLSQSL